MADLEARVKKLRDKVASRQQAKVKADHDAAVARAREEAALAALKDEFGASSIEVARAVLEKTETELADACAEAERELEAAGG